MNRNASFPNNFIKLIRTDSLGNSLWEKTYGNIDIGTEIDYIENSGFIVSGYRFEGDLARMFLLRADLEGDTVWTKTYYEYFRSGAYSIDVIENNGFIIGGVADTSKNNFLKAYVVKTDSLGNIIWQKRYSTGNNEICYSVRKYNDLGYVFCGMSDSTYAGYERAIMRIVDKSGNILYENYFRPANGNNAFRSVEVTNNGLIFCGNTTQGNSTKALIVRTDSIGQIHPVRIQNSNELIQGFRLHQNYPNPFNPVTTISFVLPQNELVELKIYDLNGREIMTLVKSFKLEGYHSVKVDGSALTSGVYFYKIQAAEFEATGKMILIK